MNEKNFSEVEDLGILTAQAMIEEKDVPPRALIMKFGLDQVLTGLFDELQGAREGLKLDIEALQKRLEEVEKIRKAIEEA